MSLSNRDERTRFRPIMCGLAMLLSIAPLAIAETYTYDDLGRLKTVTHNGKTKVYYYDAAGNRTATETTDHIPSDNAPPVCVNPTIYMNVPSYAGPVSVSVSESQLVSTCHDDDLDTLTVTSHSSLNISVSAGQSVTVSFVVSDGNGGTANGKMTYRRP